MECKKRDYEQFSEQKTLKRSSYNHRKECIKKKTMELATLCGINACTIIYGAHGGIESWPENSSEVKAMIKKFKDLTNNPNKRITVRDESQKRAVDVPAGGEVVSCQETLTEVKDAVKNFKRSRIPLTGYQEFLKQLDSKLQALTKRIEFLKTDQELDATCFCVENKQLDYSEENKRLCYSEKTSPCSKRRRIISQEPLFPFDLNYPPPDEPEPECSSLSSEDYKDLRLGIVCSF